MRLDAERAGTLEWQVRVGDLVEVDQLLGSLLLTDHCAVKALRAPRAGRVTWLRAPLLGPVEAGGALVLMDEAPEALVAQTLADARRELERLEVRLEASGGAGGNALHRALLQEEMRALELRRVALTRLLEAG